MKCLLTAINAKYIHSNLAIYDLKSYAKKFQDQIELAEYTINQEPFELLKDIYLRKPDIIAISCYIWNIQMVERLLGEIHKVLPQAELWLGGPECSHRSEEVLKAHPELKGIMIGEGERTFYELMDYYNIKEYAKKENKTQDALSRVRGIVYRKADEIIWTGERECLSLSDIPFPYQDINDFEHRIMYYESSRGCPFNCSYCLSSVEKKLRFRDLNLVKKELQFFLDRNVPQVKFVDRTFNCNPERGKEIWNFIKEHDNGKTNFHFEISADLLTKEELELLTSMRPGLVQLEIGVQSTNPQTLAAIHRKSDLTCLKRNVEIIHNSKSVHQHLDLIAGLPYEDYSSFARSFDEVYAMQPDQLQLGFLKLLSGTDIWKNREFYKIVCGEQPPYEVLYTDWLSFEDVLRLKEIEQMVEIYKNSGQFTYSIGYLLSFYHSPFMFFEELAKYWKKYISRGEKHARIERYIKLLEFAEYKREKRGFSSEELRCCLIYDIYLRENTKTRPPFADSQESWKEQKRRFYEREEREHCYLKNYDGYDRKQLAKMTHIEYFLFHPVKRKKEPVYALFDYQKRDPINMDANVYFLEKLD